MLDIYTITDQPETCPKCGTRTVFEYEGKMQKHICLTCNYKYLVK